MNKAAPRASVIILTRNEEANIGRCLDGVFAQKADFPFEVIVVDSGSTDRTLDIIRKYDLKLLQIPPEQFDHGLTRQFGAAHGTGEFVVTIVADAVAVGETWLANLLRPFAEDPNIVGVYGGQVPRENCDPFNAAQLRAWVTGGEKRVIHRLPEGVRLADMPPEKRREMVNFDDINSARRRSILEKFPFPGCEYAEDLAWAWDVLSAGYTLVYEPSAKVIHSHRRTLGYAFKKRFLDQRFLVLYFGMALYAGFTTAVRSIVREIRNYLAIAMGLKGFFRKIKWAILAPFFAMAEITGSYLGIMSARDMGRCRSDIEKQIKRKADKIARKFAATAIRHPKG
jgi:rhamnosyltransferase